MPRCIYLLLLILLSCKSNLKTHFTQSNTKTAETAQGTATIDCRRALRKLKTTGDFDGDRLTDTVFEHNFSRRRNEEIHFSPDPDHNNWDSVIRWFWEQESDIFISLGNKNTDTLHLGTGHGLFCLINIGDNNHDGRDELALEVDYADYTMAANSCSVFSLCGSKWQMLFQFPVHEFAFFSEVRPFPVFTDIPGYLEFHNGKWLFLDHQNEIPEMEEMIIQNCP